MSHTTRIKNLKITDSGALRAAVNLLNSWGVRCEMLVDAKPRMYYKDQHGSCPFVIKLHDSRYDVGLDRAEDGSYEPVFDNFMNEIGKVVGNKEAKSDAGRVIGKILQAYGISVAMQAAAVSGMTIESVQPAEQGIVNLVVGV